jgi:O-antigen/teichoic acid export membrane protein
LTLYTRLMTPDDYGFYTLVLATEAMGFTFSLLALCSATLRLLPATKDPDEFQSAVAILYLVMAIALTALFLSAPIVLPNVDRSVFRWTLALLLAHGWLEINQHIQTARLQAGRFVLANVARSLITATLGLLLVLSGVGAQGAIDAVLVGIAVPALFLTLTQWRGVRFRFPSLTTLREVLAFGAPLSLGYALDNIVYFSDRLVIAFFGGTDAVGRYAAGFDLADKSLQAIMVAVGTAGFSIALRAFESGDRRGLAQQLERNATLLLAVGMPATVGIIALARDLAALLGHDFRATAAAVIPIIAPTVFMGCMRGSYFDHSFHLSRKTLWLAAIVGVTAVLNVCLNLTLVPRMGLIGAAWATLIAYTVSLGMSVVVGRGALRMPFPAGEFARITVATAVMALTLYGLPQMPPAFSLALRVAAGGAAYVACAFLLNVYGSREKIVDRLTRSLRPAQ